MSTPITISFVIPDDCPKDIELMSIWAQAADSYMGELTDEQFRAAIVWFKSYVDSKID